MRNLVSSKLEIVVEDLTKTPHLGVFDDLIHLSSRDNSPSQQLGRSTTEETKDRSCLRHPDI